MKENTGFTFKQHLLNVKMEVAVNLLENTGTAIYDIAEKIGYENLTHFYKLFKKRHNSRTAWPRWLISFFSWRGISAKLS